MRRVVMPKAVISLLALALLSGCMPEEPQTEEEAARERELAASFAAGEDLFEEHCSSCHPRTGRGNYLKRLPVSLLSRRSEHELKEWILGSGEHREMPNFVNLDESQLHNLAVYLKQQTNR